MARSHDIKSSIGRALNRVDLGASELDYAGIVEQYQSVLTRFRPSAEEAGLSGYLMRAVLARIVGMGCTYFEQPYEVVKPFYDELIQYPPVSVDDEIGSRTMWCQCLVREKRLEEAREQIRMLDQLLQRLSGTRREWLENVLSSIRAQLDA